MRDQLAGITTLSLPYNAPPGAPRIVMGPNIPTELQTYYNVGLATMTSVILWYYGNATDTYHYYGVVDLGGGAPPGNVVRGDVLAGTVTPLDTYVGADYFVDRLAQFQSTGGVSIDSGAQFTVAGDDQVGAWTTYTPTWSNQGTANTLGAGTLTGKYHRTGKTSSVLIRLLWAADTVAGSGLWRFAMPVSVSLTAQALQCLAYDSSTGNTYCCVARVTAANGVERIGTATGVNVAGGTVPFTWANGDILTIQGTVEEA